MKHLGLFEGIGGFSLAARWMGWETVAWCEWDQFCQKVLRYHFPEATGHSDIKQTDFTIYKNAIDIITGGFPCQPYSTAGKRKGKDDERHLWPEMLRAIREIQPTWVVGENVHGLTNWNGGLVFEEVQADLEAEGYEVVPFVLPACSVGAQHKRERVWFIAHSYEKRRTISIQSEVHGVKGKRVWQETFRGKNRFEFELAPGKHSFLSRWADRPVITEFLNGFPSGLDIKAIFGNSVGAYGNAIVPQVALQIFKAIEQYEIILTN